MFIWKIVTQEYILFKQVILSYKERDYLCIIPIIAPKMRIFSLQKKVIWTTLLVISWNIIKIWGELHFK